jgi:hypothetical protein
MDSMYPLELGSQAIPAKANHVALRVRLREEALSAFSVTYQWENPQLDQVENAEAVAVPR